MQTQLIILDGRGLTDATSTNAVAQAQTPVFDHLREIYPHTTLQASGLAVGLPDGQMGNSEVGHSHIGAGRVMYQDLPRISQAIEHRTFHDHPTIQAMIQYARTLGVRVHILGLVSDGGVHSHISHIQGLCEILHEEGIADFAVHAFMDGRDTGPQTGLGFVQSLQETVDETGGHIASVIGRYYAMDRDRRLETKTKLAYDMLVHGTGDHYTSATQAIQSSYDAGIYDEFITPSIICPDMTIKPHDVVIFANFRTDRPRQLTTFLTQQNYPEFGMQMIPLYFVTMTRYDTAYTGLYVVYDTDKPTQTLGEMISSAGKTQLRISETEKYPHVTFFFSGGRDAPFDGETRLMIDSPKDVFTYDQKPEMSAPEVTDRLIAYIGDHRPDFVCLNFCNPDMVGHTGNLEAVITACETVDTQLGRVIEQSLALGYTSIIIADHGNAEYMTNDDNTPNTNHTTNLVPCIVVSPDRIYTVIQDGGSLVDVAPTILHLLDIPQPAVMTGKSLVVY